MCARSSVDRADGFGPSGRGFESLRARQKDTTGLHLESHLDQIRGCLRRSGRVLRNQRPCSRSAQQGACVQGAATADGRRLLEPDGVMVVTVGRFEGHHLAMLRRRRSAVARQGARRQRGPCPRCDRDLPARGRRAAVPRRARRDASRGPPHRTRASRGGVPRVLGGGGCRGASCGRGTSRAERPSWIARSSVARSGRTGAGRSHVHSRRVDAANLALFVGVTPGAGAYLRHGLPTPGHRRAS